MHQEGAALGVCAGSSSARQESGCCGLRVLSIPGGHSTLSEVPAAVPAIRSAVMGVAPGPRLPQE